MSAIDFGWTDFGGASRKFHYVPEGESQALCRKWAIAPWAKRDQVGFNPDNGPTEDGEPGRDDCKACYRKLHPA